MRNLHKACFACVTCLILCSFSGILLAKPPLSKRVKSANGTWLDIIFYDLNDDGKYDFVDVFLNGDWVVGMELPIISGQDEEDVSDAELDATPDTDVDEVSLFYAVAEARGSSFVSGTSNVHSGLMKQTPPISGVLNSSGTTDALPIRGFPGLESAQAAPNPTNGSEARLLFPNPAAIHRVSLTDSQGTTTEVAYDVINDHELRLDVSRVASGTYLLMACGVNGRFTVPFTILR